MPEKNSSKFQQEFIEKAVEIVGSQRELGQKIGVTQQSISLWRRGLRGLPLENALAIQRATKNKVVAKDFYPDVAEFLRVKPQPKG